MCGRYVSTRSPLDLATTYRASLLDPGQELGPSWNIAPTDLVWGVLERAFDGDGGVQRNLRPLRWGLVPSWAKTMEGSARMINARMETVHEKPAYRAAFTRRRCLLPADGYFEWEPVPARGGAKAYKQPYLLSPEDGSGMSMAGLYELWRDPAHRDDPDGWVASCTIITTEATDAAGRVHPRMPLTVSAEHWDDWLDPQHQDVADLRALLEKPAAGHLSVQPVSTAVNSVRNNGPELVTPVTAP
ncbi:MULTISPECIES: SOS response-associated peptidase [Streptacidiphilus]|uniref:Abasic site processing protein n=1 Tax=Streptacidiphilus cavernicola TaxID=3342716 RepID=A0ABV6UP32_9ACTN|nr:SOS response-associated peptidase [Streptacidiphilus jeojiense]